MVKYVQSLLAVLGVGAVVMSASPVAQATEIAAPFVTVNAGDPITIPISISDAADLTSWQYDLAFDPTIVQASLVTEGPFMSGFGATLFGSGVIDNSTGLVSLVTNAYVDLAPFPSGGGVLAEIMFIALAPGVSPLTFSNVFLNLSTDGFDISHGQISVAGSAPVPEPTTLVLLSIGVLCLAARSRRRRLSLRASALMVLMAIGVAVHPALAQTTAPGPYYALPAWDQTLSSATRFIVLSNFGGVAVLDRETGLVWERSPSNTTSVTWFAAHSLLDLHWTATSDAENLSSAWRLNLDAGTSGVDTKTFASDMRAWCVRGGRGVDAQ
jgi:hypothetical protein